MLTHICAHLSSHPLSKHPQTLRNHPLPTPLPLRVVLCSSSPQSIQLFLGYSVLQMQPPPTASQMTPEPHN